MHNFDLKKFSKYYIDNIDIDAWKFELLNKTHLLNYDYTLKMIDDEIFRLVQILDKGYPFVSYNFEKGKFLEKNFFDNEFTVLYYNDFQNFQKALEKNSSTITETLHTYQRAKMLEFLYSEKKNINLLLKNTTQTPHSPFQNQQPLNEALLLGKLRNYLFSINEKNAYKIQEEFELNELDTNYIYRTFWPIIVLTDISVLEFKNQLEFEKKKFIDKRKKFDIDIFKRDYLDFLIYELKEYLDNINRGQNKIYKFLKDTYFHWFKLKIDNTSYTLLLSKKDDVDLEIYFKELLNITELFINENRQKSLPQQNQEELNQEQPAFVNKFDNIKPLTIYSFFKARLVDKEYLTEQELNEYLKYAFELKTVPETLFKLKHTPTKQSIYTVFYTYYKDIAGKKHDKQSRYVELLGNYFEGYKNSVIKTNWAREYKSKR